jgi:hypothetical protein
MRIGRSRVLAFSGAWLEIGHYCLDCQHFLAYPEIMASTCWRCHPERIPPEYEQHLEEVRKRARAKQARGARRPVPPAEGDSEDDA